MKFLQKATLAAAVAVAPFAAQAELKAMDEAAMSATTGQAGVTIDLVLQAGTGYDADAGTDGEAAIQVGQIKYTDEGSVLINEVAVGAAAGATITQEIDVTSSGQLDITVSAVSGLKVEVGSVHLSADGTNATGESLASGIDLNVDLGQTQTNIGANSTYAAADRIGYTAAAGGNPESYDTASGVSANTMVIDSTTSVELTSSSMNALGGKVGLTGITFNDGGAGNKATIKQKIWATSSIEDTDPGTPGNQSYQGGVNIQLSSIQGDLTIGGIELGGTSIGSVTVSDIVMAGVTQKIYGH